MQNSKLVGSESKQIDRHVDVLIIGAGLAGLTVALSLPKHLKITMLTQHSLDICSSYLAQGGIAAVLDAEDSIEQHVQDTLIAGVGLCDVQNVEAILSHAPQAIDWLCQQGVPFTCSSHHHLHLTREGGHGQRRIVHVADHTGRSVTQTLQAKMQDFHNIEHLRIQHIHQLLLQDGHCIGAQVSTQTDRIALFADVVVLATGGTGQLFQQTTNPISAMGDGIALAWQAGCRVANLEFIQFHPTALALPNANGFLISEALRGEGGILRNAQGQRFMPHYDDRAELAPRDIVARAIANEIQQQQVHHDGKSYVYLDVTHLGKDFIQAHFPSIQQRCLQLGLDICTQWIPVSPSAHYSCGGVLTDAVGHTDVPYLYAVGEVACTGLHGANRLASNSLLECVVIGRNIANEIKQFSSIEARENFVWNMAPRPAQRRISDKHYNTLVCRDDLISIPMRSSTNYFSLQQLQLAMSHGFGIQRSSSGLQQLYRQLQAWQQDFDNQNKPTPHCLTTAILMVFSALQREESRGSHFNVDFPTSQSHAQITIVYPLKIATPDEILL
ncbi:MAG: L-aspartate oxidase [Acinetobacter sp.]